MKKNILLIGVMGLLASGAAQAASFNGVYGGIGLGAGQVRGKQAYTSSASQARKVSHHNVSDASTVGNLHVGYGKVFENKLYTGVEAYGTLAHYSFAGGVVSMPSSNSVKVSYKSRGSVGAKARLGRVFGEKSDSLVFASFGLDSMHMKRSTVYPYVAGTAVKKSSKMLRVNPSLGLGYEKYISSSVKVGLEGSCAFGSNNSQTLNKTNNEREKFHYGRNSSFMLKVSKDLL